MGASSRSYLPSFLGKFRSYDHSRAGCDKSTHRMGKRFQIRSDDPRLPSQRRLFTKYAESRADHGLENFADSLYPYGKNGRHEGTRTPDLYRVKVRLTHTYNNFYVLGTTAKPL